MVCWSECTHTAQGMYEYKHGVWADNTQGSVLSVCTQKSY